MQREIILGGRIVQYELTRKKVKNINVRIRFNKSISVSADSSVSVARIESFLLEKASSILAALDKYTVDATCCEYNSGDYIYLFGNALTLKVESGSKNQVLCDDEFVYLTVKSVPDTELKRKTLQKWLEKECKPVILEICEAIYPSFRELNVKYPEIKFRHMTSRWGSCQPQRAILTFNTRLAAVPKSCIEYVVMHEFVHFLQPDHSKAFYCCLARLMPDYKRRKAMLNEYTHKTI